MIFKVHQTRQGQATGQYLLAVARVSEHHRTLRVLHLFDKSSHLRLLEPHVKSASETCSRQEPVNLINSALDLCYSLVACQHAATQQFTAGNIVLPVLLELAKGHRHRLQIKAQLSNSFGRVFHQIAEPFELLRALQELHRERHQARAASDCAEDFCHCGSLNEIVLVRSC
jgi:hypothetical protein